MSTSRVEPASSPAHTATNRRLVTEPFFTQALIQNPYPIYQRYREQAELHYLDRGNAPGLWLVFSHAGCSHFFRDPRLSSSRTEAMMKSVGENWQTDFAPLSRMLGLWLLFLDSPEHSRLRKLLDKGFSPAVVEGLRAQVQRLVDEMLDRFAHASEVDLIADFAYQLPVNVIAGLMGIPKDVTDSMRTWTDALGNFIGNPNRSVPSAEAAQAAVIGMTEYFRQTVAERRRSRSNDLISLLLQIEQDGDVLTEEEVYAQCVMLLFAGHETTRNLLGNGIFTLAQNAGQAQLLREQAVDIRAAVEELLRYDSPVQAASRVAKESLEYDSMQIEAGDVVLCIMGSANRDPDCFREPEQLDLARKNNSHLAFGAGRHFCIGNQIARLEGQVAIARLFERFPRLRLTTPEPQWLPNFALRGLDKLWVSLQ